MDYTKVESDVMYTENAGLLSVLTMEGIYYQIKSMQEKQVLK